MISKKDLHDLSIAFNAMNAVMEPLQVKFAKSRQVEEGITNSKGVAITAHDLGYLFIFWDAVAKVAPIHLPVAPVREGN
jgi:hypothetical protein